MLASGCDDKPLKPLPFAQYLPIYPLIRGLIAWLGEQCHFPRFRFTITPENKGLRKREVVALC